MRAGQHLALIRVISVASNWAVIVPVGTHKIG